jgi:hypothetical protein
MKHTSVVRVGTLLAVAATVSFSGTGLTSQREARAQGRARRDGSISPAAELTRIGSIPARIRSAAGIVRRVEPDSGGRPGELQIQMVASPRKSNSLKY